MIIQEHQYNIPVEIPKEIEPILGDDGKYHYIYIIIRNHDSKFYIGKHSTIYYNDNYMGSGVRIKRSIKKYKIEAHEKFYLGFYNSEKEAYCIEREIINYELLKNKNCMNLNVGGNAINIGFKVKQLLTGRKLSNKHKLNISNGMKKHIRTKEHCKSLSKCQIGKKYSLKTKEKIGKAASCNQKGKIKIINYETFEQKWFSPNEKIPEGFERYGLSKYRKIKKARALL